MGKYFSILIKSMFIQVNKEARNQVIILPVHYGEDKSEKPEEHRHNGIPSDSDSE